MRGGADAIMERKRKREREKGGEKRCEHKGRKAVQDTLRYSALITSDRVRTSNVHRNYYARHGF